MYNYMFSSSIGDVKGGEKMSEEEKESEEEEEEED